MNIEKILVTGDSLFLRRYRPLFEAIAEQGHQLSYLSRDRHLVKIVNKLISTVSPIHANRLQKNSRAFIDNSRWLERQIKQLQEQPDFVLHVFGMYAPFWEHFDISYGMYLDYTMTLVHKNWEPWAPFATPEEFSNWLGCERLAYERSTHLFTMSDLVKSSLVDDYGISPEKITVVGSFANRHTVYEGEKKFGSKQILKEKAEISYWQLLSKSSKHCQKLNWS